MFEPRDWQIRARAAVVEHYQARRKGGNGALVVAGTGSGKTAGAHYWLHELALSQGHRILWIAAQDELVYQPLKTLHRWFPGHSSGIVKADKHEPYAQAVYASRDTLLRKDLARLTDILSYGVPSIVVLDEAHETMGKGYQRIIDLLDKAGCYRIGLTATPSRGDGRSLAGSWDLVFTYSILEAIEDGCVVRPYVSERKLPDLDLGRVAIARGDYLAPDLERELMRAHVVEHTVEALREKHEAVALPFRDRTMTFDPQEEGSALVHTVTIDQATATADALCKDNWVARTVHSKTPKGDRRRLIQAFNEGHVDVLCSPGALTQGTDMPITRANLLARPTESWRLYVQMFGRALRPYDGKAGGLTIDLVGASKKHSLVGAPVLVSGVGCEANDGGEHRYMPLDDGGGVCECGIKIRCYKGKGSHKFKSGRCEHCSAPQCPDSPDKHHQWIAWGDGKKRCVHCTLEIRDALFSLASTRPHKEPVSWSRLAEVSPDLWFVDLGRVGRLFNVRRGELWRPLWVTDRGVHPLSPAPVPAELSRLLTDDVARQARQHQGKFGLAPSQASARMSRIRTIETARKMRVMEA